MSLSLFERLSVQDVGDAVVWLTVVCIGLLVLGAFADFMAERGR